MSRLTLYKDNLTESTIVSNQFIDEYMKDANDAQIKIYLYLLRMMGANLPTSISDIADKFNHTEKDVLRALTYWEKQNLLGLDYDDKGEVCGLHMKSTSNPAPVKEAQIVPMPKIVSQAAPAPTMQEKQENNSAKSATSDSIVKPTYSLDAIAAFKKDENFSKILFIAESYLGRTLKRTDVESLVYIYDELKLSIDLIDYLIEYCVGRDKREMHYIEKVAVSWATDGVVTVRQAKNRSTRYDKLVYTVMKALGREGTPTSAEADFIQKWNKQYGFSLDVILAACEKTVVATNSHRFEYTEAILARWRENGVRNLNDVRKAEEEYRKAKQAKPVQKQTSKPMNTFNSFSQQRNYNFEQLEKELFSN